MSRPGSRALGPLHKQIGSKLDTGNLIEVRPFKETESSFGVNGSAGLGWLKVGICTPGGKIWDVPYRLTQLVSLQDVDFVTVIAAVTSTGLNVNVTMDVCSAIAFLQLGAKDGVLPEHSDTLAFVIVRTVNEHADLRKWVKLVREPLALLD